MWDNCQTSECFKTYDEAVDYAQDWAKADDIQNITNNQKEGEVM